MSACSSYQPGSNLITLIAAKSLVDSLFACNKERNCESLQGCCGPHRRRAPHSTTYFINVSISSTADPLNELVLILRIPS